MQMKLDDRSATRSVAMGYLRALVTMMVVLHHAVLPYVAQAPPKAGSFTEPPLLWAAFPVQDARTFAGFDLLVGYDDVFFMSLMFFLSGLFVPQSLARRGAGGFLRERAIRLGIPFVLGAALLAPLAYYPAWLGFGGQGRGFVADWLSLDGWPAGPVWFLWVLLALDVVAAAVPGLAGALARVAEFVQRPVAFFAAIVLVTAAAYVPLAVALDGTSWSHFGPFFIQTARAPHYALWFFAGMAVGAHGVDRGLLAPAGRLARRWWAWAIASVLLFLVEIGLVIALFSAYGRGETPSALLTVMACFGFNVACAASCLAFLGFFVRIARPSRAFDALSRNAYGVYLLHYALVSWVAYALLPAALPGIAKGTVVFVVAAAASLALTAALRRVPVFGRVLGQ